MSFQRNTKLIVSLFPNFRKIFRKKNNFTFSRDDSFSSMKSTDCPMDRSIRSVSNPAVMMLRRTVAGISQNLKKKTFSKTISVITV